MKKNARQKKDKSMTCAVGLGIGSAVILSIIPVCAMTFLVSNESVSLAAAKLALPAVQWLSVFVGCLVTGRMARDNKVTVCATVCGVYYVLLIGVSSLLMEGISDRFWVGMLVSIAGCLIAIILCKRKINVAGKRGRRRAHS